MIVKYKVTDFAKDTGLPVRKILDTLTAIGVKDKKNSSSCLPLRGEINSSVYFFALTLLQKCAKLSR